MFPTSPEIKTRGVDEKYRRIIGWRDKENLWHEVLTVIKLTKGFKDKYGFSTILKWKGDPTLSNNNISNLLVRKENKDYLISDISDTKILKMTKQKIKKRLTLLGKFHKIKHRIIIQDIYGRNFIVSLDSIYSDTNKNHLFQLEIEYAHTIKSTVSKSAKPKLEKSLFDCAKYINNILKMLRVNATKTTLRKIDFIGNQFST